jgi:hypothetical protein
MKTPIEFIEKRDLESYNIENIYSFRTMLRILYQSGLVICPQNTAAVKIPIITFLSSRIEFASSYNQNQDNEAEETDLIEAAECLILFEEFINKRNTSVTSHSIRTYAAYLHPEGA